ncbi:hypothetical protein [Streptomyces sp. BE133]|uniref:hypothetical protein n=1 Tax=Streptomyces sp. BE133 TaxID=3002523 RepID=UPI002E797C84|nr:hypothetical protein [Streptomyces sp. BE133]MEE1805627.1 hypothetical protein [Streptomyces sp. BE133]
MSHEAATNRGPTTQPDSGLNDSNVRKHRLRLLATGAAAGVVLAVSGILAVTSIMGDDTLPQTDAKTSPSPEGNKSSEPPRTPATARAVALPQPDSTAEGIGTGFEHSARGAAAAAVSYWQDFDLRDEAIARKQWAAVTSKDSPETIDRGVSGLVGEPTWGEVPNKGSAAVKAFLIRSLNDSGEVVVVWMVYDRLAVGVDGESLEDETTHLILKWEDGYWKVTEEPQYATRVHGPRSYHPDSKYAYSEGWRRVARG